MTCNFAIRPQSRSVSWVKIQSSMLRDYTVLYHNYRPSTHTSMTLSWDDCSTSSTFTSCLSSMSMDITSAGPRYCGSFYTQYRLNLAVNCFDFQTASVRIFDCFLGMKLVLRCFPLVFRFFAECRAQWRNPSVYSGAILRIKTGRSSLLPTGLE